MRLMGVLPGLLVSVQFCCGPMASVRASLTTHLHVTSAKTRKVASRGALSVGTAWLVGALVVAVLQVVDTTLECTQVVPCTYMHACHGDPFHKQCSGAHDRGGRRKEVQRAVVTSRQHGQCSGRGAGQAQETRLDVGRSTTVARAGDGSLVHREA
eukprot:jgi/Ulvmu1/4894/UM020_0180.1